MFGQYLVVRHVKQQQGPVPVATRSEYLDVKVVERDVLDRKREDAGFEGVVAPVLPLKHIAPVQRDEEINLNGFLANSNMTWGIAAVQADNSPFDGSGVVVAVLDTGIDRNHAAFKGIELIEKDFTDEGNGDNNGHGTHCAATIFGRDVGGKRIGIARGVTKALIGKVIGEKSGSTVGIASAIQWALDNGAHIISMSLGIDFPGYQNYLQNEGFNPEVATSLALEGYRENLDVFKAVADSVKAQARFRQACILVAATGNESGRNQVPAYTIAASPPAVSDGIISVGALEKNLQDLITASFSNTGADLAAPGVNVVSAKNGGGLISMSGTSMATPHVAGVAALWAQKLEQKGLFTTDELDRVLRGYARRDDLISTSTLGDVGAGIVIAPQQ